MQLRKDAKIETSITGFLLQRSFRPQSRPGNQTDFIAEQVVLVIDVEERVFLRAADDQSSNEMGNSHGVELKGSDPLLTVINGKKHWQFGFGSRYERV